MVVVITGPIASGKSTIAQLLARALTGAGVRVAVIDLDVVHEELGGTWANARSAAAARAIDYRTDGVAVVVADGSFNRSDDRAALAGVEPVYVTLRVTFEEALRRAQADPTRGVSRDRAFLGPYFADAAATLPMPPATDIVIDTEQTPAEAAAASIAAIILRRV